MAQAPAQTWQSMVDQGQWSDGSDGSELYVAQDDDPYIFCPVFLHFVLQKNNSTCYK